MIKKLLTYEILDTEPNVDFVTLASLLLVVDVQGTDAVGKVVDRVDVTADVQALHQPLEGSCQVEPASRERRVRDFRIVPHVAACWWAVAQYVLRLPDFLCRFSKKRTILKN